MFDVLYRGTHDYSDAFEKLLEFVVADHLPQMIPQFDGRLEWLLADDALYNRFVPIYAEHFKAIHADRYDYLGDMYVDMQGRFSQSVKGQFLTPHTVCEMVAQITLAGADPEKPVNVLDPAVGTGRMLIAAHKYVPPGSVFFGVDIDNRAIRTAFANACIQKIPMRLLCADSLRHATDIATDAGRHNWRNYCNQWQSHYAELKTLADEHRELQQKRVIPKKESLEKYREKKAEQLSLFDYVGK